MEHNLTYEDLSFRNQLLIGQNNTPKAFVEVESLHETQTKNGFFLPDYYSLTTDKKRISKGTVISPPTCQPQKYGFVITIYATDTTDKKGLYSSAELDIDLKQGDTVVFNKGNNECLYENGKYRYAILQVPMEAIIVIMRPVGENTEMIVPKNKTLLQIIKHDTAEFNHNGIIQIAHSKQLEGQGIVAYIGENSASFQHWKPAQELLNRKVWVLPQTCISYDVAESEYYALDTQDIVAYEDDNGEIEPYGEMCEVEILNNSNEFVETENGILLRQNTLNKLQNKSSVLVKILKKAQGVQEEIQVGGMYFTLNKIDKIEVNPHDFAHCKKTKYYIIAGVYP